MTKAKFHLGSHQAAVDAALAEMSASRVLPRLWELDHTLWKPDPAEISNRLGWLHIAEDIVKNVPRMQELLQEARQDGYTHVLLLGMGGSSLAPELFSQTFGGQTEGLDLAVLDSTDPGAVLAHAQRLDLARALFIVATKSGGTVETISFFKFFYNRVAAAVGEERAGEHFVAITDAGSKLDKLAERYNFRAVFLNDPNIGGRFSVLSYFGLLPAALLGVDVPRLLERALEAARACGPEVQDNPAARLGAVLSELARAGRDKVTFAISPDIASFGDWVEQLVAESTGKEGQGILPVVGEPLGAPDVYGDDRLFVHLQLDGDESHEAAIQALQEAGYPLVHLRLRDRYDLGAQFFVWELATAIASHRLHINPFDQPNVEAAKILAQKMVAEYKKKGALPAQTPTLTGEGVAVYGDLPTPPAKQKPKIVCIESKPELVDLVRLILGRRGFKVLGAVGGKAGLEKVRRIKPELALVGRTLTDMDSQEVCRQIEADETLQNTTVILMGDRAQRIDELLEPHIVKPGGAAFTSPAEALAAFLGLAQAGDYIALQAYVQPAVASDAALLALRARLRDHYKLATTVGYGPRFLHSTGQLHKGDAGRGLFIQFTADAPQDAPIPDEAGASESSISFHTLELAQALGDGRALLDAGRRVLRFHLGDDVLGGLKKL
jgi:glucose-6-phosphate isomerase